MYPIPQLVVLDRFLQMGRKGQLSAIQPWKWHKSSFSWELVRNRRWSGHHAIRAQTLLTGAVWKWFWLESHSTAIFLVAWSSRGFPLTRWSLVCCRMVRARSGALHCFHVAAPGLDSVWDSEQQFQLYPHKTRPVSPVSQQRWLAPSPHCWYSPSSHALRRKLADPGKSSSHAVNMQQWGQKLLPSCCSMRWESERAFRWAWSQSVCLHPLWFCQRGERKKKPAPLFSDFSVLLDGRACGWQGFCCWAPPSSGGRGSLLYAQLTQRLVCPAGRVTGLSLNTLIFGDEKAHADMGDFGRLHVFFFLSFYAPRSRTWLTECNFSPGSSLLRLNDNIDFMSPSSALLKNQAAAAGASRDSSNGSRLPSTQPNLSSRDGRLSGNDTMA